MSRYLASVEPDGPLFRLGRQSDPWAWPDWAYAGPDGTFGNRYDDDAATIRLRAPRAFTQNVSRFVYEQRDEQGSFAGIRYRSRLGDEIVNWAVFEPAPDAPSPFLAKTSMPIEADDADLVAALDLLGLTLV